MSEMEKPPLSFKVGDKEIKMTYGLEMDLRRLLPGLEAVTNLIMEDPHTQDYVIRRCLTDYKGLIKSFDDLIPAEEVEATTEEIEGLLLWVAEHMLYFFAKRMSRMEELGVQVTKILPKPTSSGSSPSASKTPSAGPSES